MVVLGATVVVIGLIATAMVLFKSDKVTGGSTQTDEPLPVTTADGSGFGAETNAQDFAPGSSATLHDAPSGSALQQAGDIQ